jgi:glycosyltransferase involved in cell wall biosynthesis
MRVWLVRISENLPMDEGARLFRTGLLAQELVRQGHEVIWWADTFSHHRKAHRADRNTTVQVAPNWTIEMLYAPPYRRNISLARLRNHRIVAEQFLALAPSRPPPDVIYCSYPIIDLAFAATGFARERGIPLLLDVRDYWPDVFLEHLPGPLRAPARLALTRYYRMGREALRRADVLTSMCARLLEWAEALGERTDRSRDEVFHLGSEDPAGKEEEPVILPDAQPRLRCLYVGTLGHSTDLPATLEAARLLNTEGIRDVQFVLAGDGPWRERLVAQARGLPNVVFTGWLSAAQVRFLLARSHAGLMAIANRWAFPNKVFEYLSCGLALLNSAEGELAEVVTKEGVGLNYAAGDAQALASRIKDLRDRPQALQECRRRARALFVERFEASPIYSRMARKLTALAAPARPTKG